MINDFPSEEVCVAMSWSGDYAQAMARAEEGGADVHLAYSVPSEGTVLWVDGLFIPTDAQHPNNAHLFINYLMRPNVIAAVSNLIRYANANLASIPLMRPEVSKDPAVYPPESERDQLVTGLVFGPKLERRRSRAWARIKTGL